jgi:hypothetical protein
LAISCRSLEIVENFEDVMIDRYGVAKIDADMRAVGNGAQLST